VEKYGTDRQTTDDSIIRRMHCEYWIPKATDTHSEYVTLIAFPRQQWLRERASMLRYTYFACLIVCGIIRDKYIRITSELNHDATCTTVNGWRVVWADFLKDKIFCMSCM